MSTYQNARNVKRESRTVAGRFRGGKLVPVMAVGVRPSEYGTLSQSITLELDPIMGRLITPIRGELQAVFVPVQAIDAIKDPEADYAGLTEVIREKLLSGNPLFGTESEGEISQRCGVIPRRIGPAVYQVSEAVRLAHNCAVNFLRQQKYHKATLLLHSSTAITPAILSQTVLERLNGVLDPDDRINGSFQLDMPAVHVPVRGIGTRLTADSALAGNPLANRTLHDDRGRQFVQGAYITSAAEVETGYTSMTVEFEDGLPNIRAELDEIVAGTVSLTDIYNAETQDKLVRAMRRIVEENPQYGEEMVLRWAHGLSVDAGKTPWLLAKREVMFGRSIVGATDSDGIENEVMRSDMAASVGFDVVVPRTELGGIIITFATIRPDETLADQPHPILSDVWGLDNFVADELALDPVPVTMRDLDCHVADIDQNTVAFYTGLNQLKATYVNYGFARNLSRQTVENKTAIWQLEIPTSVTPGNILYPEDLDHYPFADQEAEVCTYVVSSAHTLQTPMIIGPTPVEELAVIGEADLFEENE